MSQQTRTESQLVVAGRAVVVLRKEQPYEKVNAFSNTEEITIVDSVIRYHNKYMDRVVTADELKEISPFMHYIMKHYTR